MRPGDGVTLHQRTGEGARTARGTIVLIHHGSPACEETYGSHQVRVEAINLNALSLNSRPAG